MATFKPNTFDYSAINGGNRFENGDGVDANAINAPIEAAAFMQELGTNAPDVSRINGLGTPAVSIDLSTGRPRFVFENLKGAKGDSGLNYGASISDTVNDSYEEGFGYSRVNGYSQNVINSLTYRPNLLINGDFRINQRGKSGYRDEYSVDRWYIDFGDVSVNDDKTITVDTFYTGSAHTRLIQHFDNFEHLRGQTIVMSAKITCVSDTGTYAGGFAIYDGTSWTEYRGFEEQYTGTKDYVLWAKAKIPVDATKFAIAFEPNGTSKNNMVKIYWIKAEVGETPTKFVPKSYRRELTDCEFYYKRFYPNSYQSAWLVAQGAMLNNTWARFCLPFAFRTTPTINFESADIEIGGADYSVDSISFIGMTNDSIAIKATVPSGLGITAGSHAFLALSVYDSDNSYIEFDAEIY